MTDPLIVRAQRLQSWHLIPRKITMKPLTAASLLALAPFLSPAITWAGTECRAFGSTGYVVNWHQIIDQSDAGLKSVVGLGGNLCGPAAGAHVLAGFDDFPRMPSTSDAIAAGFNDVDVDSFGGIIRKLGLAMDTNGTLIDIDAWYTNLEIQQKGTMAWDVAAPMKSSLKRSFYSFGSDGDGGTLPTKFRSKYSGLLPSNFTADTLAEPICADVSLQGKPNPGGAAYDYAKTQSIMSYGYFDISQITVPVPCGDWYTLGLDKWCNVGTGLYTVMMTGGHFVAVVGGYDDGSSKHIAIANPHNNLYWSNVRQITIEIPGVGTIFDRAGTVWDPSTKHANQTKIVTSYTTTRVWHGGTCVTGSLRMSGASRGNCVVRASAKP